MLHRLVLAYATRVYKNASYAASNDTGLCSLSADPILRAYVWYFDLKVKYTMFKQRLWRR